MNNTTAPNAASAQRRASAQTADAAFVSYVQELCRDRGSRAALRRAGGRPSAEALEAMPYLERCISPDSRPARVEAIYCVAALIAMTWEAPRTPHRDEADTPDEPRDVQQEASGDAPHPNETTEGQETHAPYRSRNLGASLAAAIAKAGYATDSPTYRAAERLLRSAARDDAPGIRDRLPRLVDRFEVTDVDWAQLLDELTWWDQRTIRPGVHWMRSFYRAESAQAPAADTAEPAPTTAD
ncbi:MAG: type I-E CRISPR-associated protein Cse2/CasB [Kineosporiaceae bacterium]|nr:type I-E CRISPR-associated protein Cse2/CasB [Kineosporiaceae bacterium]